MTRRWLAALVLLAGCGGTRTFEPPDPLNEPTAYLVFDLDGAYEVLDIRYAPRLVSDSGAVTEASVQVLARRRDTGQEALLLYDPARLRGGPTTVIELRRGAARR